MQLFPLEHIFTRSECAREPLSLYTEDSSQLLQPMYPGQLPSVKLNLFNVIVALDLSQTSSLNFLTGAVFNIIDRNFPVRFGLVPIVETEDGEVTFSKCSIHLPCTRFVRTLKVLAWRD